MRESRVNVTLIAALKYLLLIVFVAFLLSQARGAKASLSPFEDVQSAVLSAADLTPMTEGDNQMIRRIYGLDPDSFEGILLYYPTSSMSVEEILLVKLTDVSQGDSIRQVMEDRIQSQIDVFAGYGPEQVAMLEKAIVEVRGNYALLVVADQPDAVRQAFLAAL